MRKIRAVTEIGRLVPILTVIAEEQIMSNIHLHHRFVILIRGSRSLGVQTFIWFGKSNEGERRYLV